MFSSYSSTYSLDTVKLAEYSPFRRLRVVAGAGVFLNYNDVVYPDCAELPLIFYLQLSPDPCLETFLWLLHSGPYGTEQS